WTCPRVFELSNQLPLAELEPTPRAALAVLLSFLHAAVARQVAGAAKGHFQPLVILRQGTTQAHHDRASLPGRAAAVGVYQHVHLARDVGHFQRAEDRLAVALGREVIVERAAIHFDLAVARRDAHASDGRLAPAYAPDVVALDFRFGRFASGGCF